MLLFYVYNPLKLEDTNMLTRQNIIDALPKTSNTSVVTEGVVSLINNALEDATTMQRYRENLVGFNKILQEGRYKLNDYLHAVMYVSFKLMGYTNIDAYARTFPKRVKDHYDSGKEIKDLHAYVHGYHRTKLVTTLLGQAQIPTHILNADIYQEAINRQRELMTCGRLDVEQKAAASLMEHLAPPVESKVKLEIENTNQTNFIDLMAEQVKQMGELQRQQLINGQTSLRDISKQRVVHTIESE